MDDSIFLTIDTNGLTTNENNTDLHLLYDQDTLNVASPDEQATVPSPPNAEIRADAVSGYGIPRPIAGPGTEPTESDDAIKSYLDSTKNKNFKEN